jgi:hypothetical protein
MRRSISLLAPLGVATVLAATAAVRAETWPLEIRHLDANELCAAAVRNLSFLTGGKGTSHIRMPGMEEQGEEQAAAFKRIVKKEPTYLSKNPLRSVIKLGSREYAFALDAVPPKPAADSDSALGKLQEKLLKALSSQNFVPAYNRLYFDCNGNGDLTDDGVTEAQQASGMNQPGKCQFSPVKVTIDIDGTKFDYSLVVSSSTSLVPGGGLITVINFGSATCREGDITVDGNEHHVVLLDFNCNGRFDDQPTPAAENRPLGLPPTPRPGDVLLVDTDDSGMRWVSANSLTGPKNSNQLMVSRVVALDGRFYDMQVSPSGDKLTLNPTKQLGNISNVPDDFHAVIYNDTGILRVRGNKAAPMALPEGQWKLLSYEIEVADYHKPQPSDEKKEKEEPVMREMGKGQMLVPGGGTLPMGHRTLIMAKATADCKSLVIRAGDTLAIPFGPPFRPVVTAGKMNPDGETLPLALALIGLGGEQVNNVAVEGQRPPKPTFTITDDKGKVIEEGNFEYG